MAERLIVEKIESISPEKGEYARVKLIFTDGSSCVIVIGTILAGLSVFFDWEGFSTSPAYLT